MLKIVRSNCNSIPQSIPANSPAWLQDIHQKLADPLNASNRIYRIVPTSRRRKFLTRHLAQSAKIIPQIITLDQWINELSAQGLLGELTMMTETQRHLVLAKAWHQTTKKKRVLLSLPISIVSSATSLVRILFPMKLKILLFSIVSRTISPFLNLKILQIVIPKSPFCMMHLL